MISGTIALAFTAGMVATFNPCGFSLLPAYIGAFVAGDEPTDRIDRRVARAIGVAAAVSTGFIIVFSTVGLIIDSIASQALRQLPWVTIVIGGLLIIAGGATLAGWKPALALRGPQLSNVDGATPDVAQRDPLGQRTRWPVLMIMTEHHTWEQR